MICIMTFALHLINTKSFNNYYISWMYLKFGFVDTWISQGESFVDIGQVLSDKPTVEEGKPEFLCCA